MKYLEAAIPRTVGDLRALISDTMLRAPRRQFPESRDFDGAFYSAFAGVENLRNRIGNAMADQLLDMLAQAKVHYESGANKLGGALMEDTKTLVIGRKPWAYPKELYRWSLGSSLPELTEADVRRKIE